MIFLSTKIFNIGEKVDSKIASLECPAYGYQLIMLTIQHNAIALLGP